MVFRGDFSASAASGKMKRGCLPCNVWVHGRGDESAPASNNTRGTGVMGKESRMNGSWRGSSELKSEQRRPAPGGEKGGLRPGRPQPAAAGIVRN